MSCGAIHQKLDDFHCPRLVSSHITVIGWCVATLLFIYLFIFLISTANTFQKYVHTFYTVQMDALYVGELTDSNLKIRVLLLYCYLLTCCIGRILWSLN
jgi:hypothetical protein